MKRVQRRKVRKEQSTCSRTAGRHPDPLITHSPEIENLAGIVVDTLRGRGDAHGLITLSRMSLPP